ncbi:hypothetical protein K6119_05950 [Paracrocinitomix mangrovi]|uniref:hypothetical protein n=1 Tax=Paracrocinitomix mangrovi TaxID=2862509 RepID=UPI001C8F18E2|nr:hypothetical protein [Paracrocinitomix mangrovi]UKN03053.1 hypothetical protein K6119_05950 [Paracrocinitomix mangrovi]
MRLTNYLKALVLPIFLGAFVAFGNTNADGTEAKVNVAKAIAASKIDRVDTWTEHTVFNGIKIEYKFEDCTIGRLDRQCVIFFKFTNTTDKIQVLSWNLEIWMDEQCKNCHKLDNPEYYHELTLKPGESIEGSQQNSGDRALYVFHHWARLVPGMTKTELTKFEFTNMETKVSK